MLLKSVVSLVPALGDSKLSHPTKLGAGAPAPLPAAGKVEIGGFRTFPEGYKPPDDGPSEYQTIPLSKIEDFGVHAKQYYSLDVSFFKSSLDAHLLDMLWNKYWLNTLSASPLIANREFAAGQISDIAGTGALPAGIRGGQLRRGVRVLKNWHRCNVCNLHPFACTAFNLSSICPEVGGPCVAAPSQCVPWACMARAVA